MGIKFAEILRIGLDDEDNLTAFMYTLDGTFLFSRCAYEHCPKLVDKLSIANWETIKTYHFVDFDIKDDSHRV